MQILIQNHIYKITVFINTTDTSKVCEISLLQCAMCLKATKWDIRANHINI